MSNFQSSLVQFAYYGAYFLLALPAGFINKHYGYKTGVRLITDDPAPGVKSDDVAFGVRNCWGN